MKFRFHFAMCQIKGTRQSLVICRVPWSGTRRSLFFSFFLFPSSFILPNWLPCTLNILIKFTQLYIFNSSTHIVSLSYGVIDQNSIYINSIIALDTLKLSSGSKKLPKFYTKQYILSIGYRKFFEVKPKFDRRFHFKPNRILLNSLILLRRCFHC